MRFLKDADISGKRVLVRANLDVPLDDNGNVTDDSRLRDSLPTINFLLRQQAKIILIGHLGRPCGRVVEKLRLDNVAKLLSALLMQPVKKTDDCVGPEAEAAVNQLKEGEVLLLENLRFHKEEEENDRGFAKALASHADAYVNDAFSNSHREHASMVSITEHLPSYAGLGLEREIKSLSLENAKRPLVMIIGGAKLETKLPVISRLSKIADNVLIGGAIMFTFLKAKGFETGKSKIESEFICTAKKLLACKKIILPVDVVAATALSDTAKTKIVSADRIPPGMLGADIGPKTVELFKRKIKKAGTVVWNGPLGAFEYKQFANGTSEVACALACSKSKNIIGGGDTLSAVSSKKLAENIGFFSTGGGAMLDLLAGKELPGIKALR